VNKEQGFKAWMQFKGEVKKLTKILKSLKKMLESKKLVHQLSASYHTRKI